MSKILVPMQDAFCREYLVDLHGQNAAIRAGYSEKSAKTQASTMLADPDIQARIADLNQERLARVQVESDTVLRELLRIATSDIGEAFDDSGRLKPLKEIPTDVRRAIQSIEVDELFDGFGQERTHVGYTKKLKFWDKNKALEMLGKHLKLFTEKLEVSGSLTLEALVVASQKKEIEGD